MRGYFEPDLTELSGSISSGEIGSGAIQGFFGSTRHIASGTIGVTDFGSGAVITGTVGSGAIQSGNVASGQLGNFHLASGQVQGLAGTGVPNLASGTATRHNLNSGCVIDFIACEQAVSGIIAVAWGSGKCFVVPAERGSGLRLPAIGIVAGNFVSGAIVPVVRRGLVRGVTSGVMASGLLPIYLYLGSGGLIIDQSGFHEGLSSGHGAAPTAAGSGYSGALVQRLGSPISGGIDVQIGELTSGLFSGLLGQF